MEPISEAWSSELRDRGAEEIINISNLSRNCIRPVKRQEAAWRWEKKINKQISEKKNL